MYWLYKAYRKLRGRWVVLFDFDDEANVRRAYQIGGVWMADRMSFGIGVTVLRDDGTTSGPSYVKRWAVQ